MVKTEFLEKSPLCSHANLGLDHQSKVYTFFDFDH